MGENRYMWQKNKNLLETRRNREIRRFRKLGKFWGPRRLGRFGKTGDSRESGGWGKSLNVAKTETLSDPGEFGRSGDFGDWKITTFGDLGD